MRCCARAHRNRRHHPIAPIAHHIQPAVEDHLRRINAGAIHRPRIGFLPPRIGVSGESVFPAQNVPIGDGKRQRDDIAAVRQFRHQTIGRRTIAAALARKQFQHNGMWGRCFVRVLALARHSASGGESRQEQTKRDGAQNGHVEP